MAAGLLSREVNRNDRMNEGSQLLDILLFAAIAAFLVLRLRNVLGRRTGHDSRPEFDPFKQKQEAPQTRSGPEDDKVIPLPHNDRRPQEANLDRNDPVAAGITRSEEHTSELQSRGHLVCRLL